MALTASVIAPPEVVVPVPDATRFGAPPVSAASPLTGDDVQDILVTLPRDEDGSTSFPDLTLSFATAAKDLTARMAQTCDSVYLLAGTPGLMALQAALRGTGRSAAPGAMLSPEPRRGEPLYLDEERSPRRHRLITAFEAYLEDLPGRRSGAEAVVATMATAAAQARLNKSRAQVLSEAKRYFSLAVGGAVSPEAFITGPRAHVRLTGPEILGLARDLLAVLDAREELDHRASTRKRAIANWDAAKRSVLAQDLERREVRQGRLDERDILDLAKQLEKLPDPPDVAAARQQVADQQVALAHLVAGLGASRPIIFKLWNTDAAAEVRHVLLRSRAANTAQQQAAIATSVPFRDAVIDALASTWNSAATLLERFAEDPVAPFRFPALIDDTLAALHVGEGDFATRVARDRVAGERPGADLAVVSTWLGHVGLVGLTGVPPLEAVAAVAMVAQLAVSAIELVGKGFRLYEQHLGTDAFFAPSAALAVDPTYSALAVDVYLLMLNVLLSAGDIGRLVPR